MRHIEKPMSRPFGKTKPKAMPLFNKSYGFVQQTSRGGSANSRTDKKRGCNWRQPLFCLLSNFGCLWFRRQRPGVGGIFDFRNRPLQVRQGGQGFTAAFLIFISFSYREKFFGISAVSCCGLNTGNAVGNGDAREVSVVSPADACSTVYTLGYDGAARDGDVATRAVACAADTWAAAVTLGRHVAATDGDVATGSFITRAKAST